MALWEFFILICKHFEDYCSLLSKTCQTTKLQVILRLHITGFKPWERPSTWEYVEFTGLYIRVSQAMKEMDRETHQGEILLSMWSHLKVFKMLRGLLQLFQAGATAADRISRFPRCPRGNFFAVSSFPICRNAVLCFVALSVFRRFGPRSVRTANWHRQDGPVWEQHQTSEAPAVPDVQRPEAAQSQQQQPAAHRHG